MQTIRKTNYATIIQFVNTSIYKFWPGKNSGKKILLLILYYDKYTNIAIIVINMLKKTKHSMIFYPNTIYLTCLVQSGISLK